MRIATEVFGEWAQQGKDIGMQQGHASAVEDMIDFAIKERKSLERDAGWIRDDESCNERC